MTDDGRDDIPVTDIPHPNAIYVVDSHLGPDKRVEWAKHFDHVFVAQKSGVRLMAEHGIVAHWLPLACHRSGDPCLSEMLRSPERMKKYCPWPNLNKQFDHAFVGFMNRGSGEIPKGLRPFAVGDPDGHDRVAFLDAIFKAFPNGWLSFQNFFEDAAVRYIKARVGLNVSIRDDLNMRFFEGLSYGTCLLSNRDQEGWQELGFVEDVHFLGYESHEEAIAKLQWALDNPMEREEIAAAGHAFVRANHQYRHRMLDLLRICGVSAEREEVAVVA